MNYYNEHDAYAAAWLRNLIAEGLIPPGEVDERDIRFVEADDVRRFTQCHFFAGIAGWSLALQLAGWPTTEPVWTGSCPCQPFSAAGKRKGEADERHLWPEFYRLIGECRPATVFGEQVASADGLLWLDGVSLDLEAAGYAVGSSDLPAASVGAPHRRQRLWFVATALERLANAKYERHWPKRNGSARGRESFRSSGGLGHADGGRCEEREERNGDAPQDSANGHTCGPDINRSSDGLGNASEPRLPLPESTDLRGARGREEGRAVEQSGRAPNPWSAYELIPCRDGKARRIEPGSAPLAYGIPGRVGKLRAFGNAICPQVAAEFIKAYLEATQ